LLTYLDPKNADEREAIEYFLDRSDKNPDRYPALHGGRRSLGETGRFLGRIFGKRSFVAA